MMYYALWINMRGKIIREVIIDAILSKSNQGRRMMSNPVAKKLIKKLYLKLNKTYQDPVLKG